MPHAHPSQSHLCNFDLPFELARRMIGPCPPHAFRSHEPCHAPARFRKSDLRPANHFHQWARKLAASPAEQRKADRDFYENLRVCGAPSLMAAWWYMKARGSGLTRQGDQRPWRRFIRRVLRPANRRRQQRQSAA
jgi:hypothetical protein